MDEWFKVGCSLFTPRLVGTDWCREGDTTGRSLEEQSVVGLARLNR